MVRAYCFVFQCLGTRILFTNFSYVYISEVNPQFLFFIMSLPSFMPLFWPHGMNWGILSFFSDLWKRFQKLDS